MNSRAIKIRPLKIASKIIVEFYSVTIILQFSLFLHVKQLFDFEIILTYYWNSETQKNFRKHCKGVWEKKIEVKKKRKKIRK